MAIKSPPIAVLGTIEELRTYRKTMTVFIAFNRWKYQRRLSRGLNSNIAVAMSVSGMTARARVFKDYINVSKKDKNASSFGEVSRRCW